MSPGHHGTLSRGNLVSASRESGEEEGGIGERGEEGGGIALNYPLILPLVSTRRGRTEGRIATEGIIK